MLGSRLKSVYDRAESRPTVLQCQRRRRASSRTTTTSAREKGLLSRDRPPNAWRTEEGDAMQARGEA
jgi:hypothetical protein